MLKGKKVFLRAVEPEDAEILYKWENDFELWKVSNTLTPFSVAIIKKYIEVAHLDIYETKQLRLMIQENRKNGKVVGMIDLFDFDPYHSRAGIGIVIHKNFRNNGYASEALQILKNYAFNYLNLHQLYCNIAVDNTISITLFENEGFKKVCVRKDWYFNGSEFKDINFYQLINPNHVKK